MRLLSKAEACQELSLSLSTLNRRIAAGEVPVRREPRGRRHRVYVMLDDDPPSAIESPPSELIAAQKRIQDLEGQVALLQEQLDWERQRNAGLVGRIERGANKNGAKNAASPGGGSGSGWGFSNRSLYNPSAAPVRRSLGGPVIPYRTTLESSGG